MKNLIFAALIATLSISALANESKALVKFDFKRAKALFEAAKMPSENEVTGSWYVIGHGTMSTSFDGYGDYYYPSLKPSKETSFLKIEKYIDPLDQSENLEATYTNVPERGRSQGSNEATINAGRRALVTRQYAYLFNEIQKTYWRFDCRLVAQNQDLLICGLTIKYYPSERNSYEDEALKFDNVMGAYNLFKRR